MALHARSVAVSAGASELELDAVVRGLIAAGDVKLSRAHEVLTSLREITADR